MRIIVDTMGSDKGCAEVTCGALDAARAYGVDLTLVGDEKTIAPIVEASGLQAEIVSCAKAISMEDDPMTVRNVNKDCSMVTAFRLLQEGKGDAAVTAGSTGAAITAATLYVHRIRGIRRAALGTVLPLNGGTILMDSGANADCTPEYLLQFAIMGSYYAQAVFHKERPRVGLLNIGTEETKGDTLRLAAYPVLKSAAEEGLFDFVGNIEARSVASDAADVIVADGFSGNVMLKAMEGIGLFFGKELKKQLMSSFIAKIGGLLVRKKIYSLKKLMDYREVGGSPLIGIAAPVIKSHGSANAYCIQNAIHQAILYAQGDVCGSIKSSVEKMQLKDN